MREQNKTRQIFPGLWIGLTLLALPSVVLLAQTSAADKAKVSGKAETTTQKATQKGTEKAAAPSTPKSAEALEWPPQLPGGVDVVSDESPELLVKPEHVELKPGVKIARTAPRIDFAYYPGQDEFTKLWSVWGDGLAVGTKYYSSIGDHASPNGRAQVYEFDSATKKMRLLAETTEVLESSGTLPKDMQYRPGKIHSRIDMGSDGWLYYATHRGSSKSTTDAYGYKGDWVFRTHPETGKSEIAAAYPVPKHAIPASILDPERLIFYGSTKAGGDSEHQDVRFFAYDVKNGKLLKTAPTGFNRYAIFSSSTGAVYWKPRDGVEEGNKYKVDGVSVGAGRKYDPNTNEITEVPAAPEVRAATQETKDGLVYGVSGTNANLWVFNVKDETFRPLGDGGVATQRYVTSIDVDPSGRYLYYIPGAHGGGVKDGTPIVQFDTKTNTRKIIAFLNEYYTEKYSYAPDGTFGSALSPDGSTLYVTWNGRRIPDAKSWDTVAMTAIHIPASERQP